MLLTKCFTFFKNFALNCFPEEKFNGETLNLSRNYLGYYKKITNNNIRLKNIYSIVRLKISLHQLCKNLIQIYTSNITINKCNFLQI